VRPALILRLLAAIAAFAVVYVAFDRLCGGRVTQAILDLGQWSGCQVENISAHMLWTESGPYLGDDLKSRVFNGLVTHGQWSATTASGFITALAAYALMARRAGYRAPGRGPTRCGHCRYILAGLREPRCPECGRRI
jgi:hypothetical protein